jgi:hypothetical protein
MYIFVDEFGSMDWPKTNNPPLNEGIFILGALAVQSNASLRRLSLSVTRAIQDQIRSNPQLTRLIELKGDDIGPKARKRIFNAVRRCEDVMFYALIIKKTRYTGRLPRSYIKRYNRVVINLLARLPLPGNLRRVTLVLDQGGVANGREQHLSLVNLFRHYIQSRAVHLAVRIRHSHVDRCLQAADVFTNFCYRSLAIEEKLRKITSELECAVDFNQKRRLEKQLKAERKHARGWAQSRHILAKHLCLWKSPPRRLLRKSLSSIVKSRITSKRKKRDTGTNRSE